MYIAKLFSVHVNVSNYWLSNQCGVINQLYTVPVNMLLFSWDKQSHKSCLPYHCFLLAFKGLLQPEVIGGGMTLSVV